MGVHLRDLLLFLSTPLLMYIFAAVFGVVFARDTSRKENLALALGWTLLGTGFLISLLLPNQLGRLIVAITHVPYTLAAIVMSWGLLTRNDIAPPFKSQSWIAVSGFLVLIAVQAIGTNIQADLLITNLTCGIIFVMTAQLLSVGAQRDIVEKAILAMVILTTAQFFIRPIMTLMVEGPLAAETYKNSIYYLAMLWVFAFGSVLFGLTQVAGAVKDQVAALRDTTATDPLSGLLMRAEFEKRVREALTLAARKNVSVSLVLGDIDHFKQVNDLWGHLAGDRAIAAFGEMVGNTIRSTDIAGRIGGEEFCILVWNADAQTASGLAERLRLRTQELCFGSGSLDVRLTASFGVAGRAGTEGYRSLFARVDKALYVAKENGRDRVCNADEPANIPQRVADDSAGHAELSQPSLRPFNLG